MQGIHERTLLKSWPERYYRFVYTTRTTIILSHPIVKSVLAALANAGGILLYRIFNLKQYQIKDLNILLS